MQANKDKNYQINEADAGRYHVEFTKHKKTGMKTFPFTMVQIFSIKDFNSLDRTIDRQGIFVTGWHEMRIIHDPVVYLAEVKERGEAAAMKEHLAAGAEKKRILDEAKAEAAKKAKEKADKKKADVKADV